MERETDRAGLPEWLAEVGGACWVSAPDGRLAWANAEAQRLLACDAPPAPGQPCFAALRGTDEQGHAFCRPECRALLRARLHRPVDPFLLRLGGPRGTGAFYMVQVVPLRGADGSGTWLVHLGANVDRLHRMEEYLQEVAQRTRPVPARLPGRRLSRREAEILALLVHDQDTKRIATRLFLSHATVRNHVAHILAKLGVHSVAEAVAWQLLQGGAAPPRATGEAH